MKRLRKRAEEKKHWLNNVFVPLPVTVLESGMKANIPCVVVTRTTKINK